VSEHPEDPVGPGRRAALGNMAWLLGDKAFALVVGLAIHGLIARTLGPVGSGHFAYASAILQAGLGLSLVCAGVALLPRFCRMNGALPGAIANVFALRVVASVVAMLVMMGFCVLMVDDPQRRMISLILLLAVPLIEPFYVIATYWLSRNHNRPTVIARTSGLMVRALIVVAGVVWGAPVWVLAAAWVVESAVNASLQTLQAGKAFPGRQLVRFVRPSRMRQYLSFGLRFVLALWLAQLFLRIDRLVLANWLTPTEFGIYAAPMQLVEVWTQVAYLIGSSIATAYLYKKLRDREVVRAFLTTAAAMAGVGLLGLLGAWLLGPTLLRVVFGPAFEASYPFLLAGAAFAVLLFADQAVDMLIMGLNLPRLLAVKWGVALAVSFTVFWFGFPRLGAFVGPVGMTCGVVSAWVALLLLPRRWRGGRGPHADGRDVSEIAPT
jgi:O-antigen/teichoic acid export membrane protein